MKYIYKICLDIWWWHDTWIYIWNVISRIWLSQEQWQKELPQWNKITFSCFTIASPLDSSKNVADTTSKIFIHTFDLLISFIVLVIFNRQVSSSTKWKVDGLLNCKIDTTSWKLMIRVKSINWKTLESGRYCT